MDVRKIVLSAIALSACCTSVQAQQSLHTYLFNSGWHAVCYPEDKARYGDSIVMDNVSLPHNFDDYYGARQLVHGNLHGTAVYDFRFVLPDGILYEDLGYRLNLEGAGSYVTVIMNGDTLCERRPAGRIVTTIKVPETDILSKENHLRIICHHPSHITDLPWVCGGCSSEWGFSEGSQPLGLFRGVNLEEVRGFHIAPFGVHAWTNPACDTLFVETEIEKSARFRNGKLRLKTSVHQPYGVKHLDELAQLETKIKMRRDTTSVIRQVIPIDATKVKYWTPDTPNLYEIRSSLIYFDNQYENDRVSHELRTDFGFRQIEWGRQFKVNGQPVFLNGVCDYEHSFGHSHALTTEEIDHMCEQVRSLGYNSFRDAHQPHNLRFQKNWNRLGITYWAQFSAHIWYDTPAFRENFKTLLRQWVKERRNDPSLVLWGLQNESTLPKDFAEECTAIIKEMDPTCSRTDMASHLADPGASQNVGRLVTTCNGGTGTDWNVIQNWSGTYGGKLENYGQELKQDNQLLNGEYGAWRTVGLHDTLTVFNSKAPYSEEKFSMLLRSKMDQAWASRDSVCGQYLWLMHSHDNPGRYQPDEALRLIDKVGPFNYKGLYTNWGQPTDFARTLLKDTIEFSEPDTIASMLFRGIPDMVYLYRLNCGGDTLIDTWGQVWAGDDTRFSSSWSQRPVFAKDSLNPVLASQGVTDGKVVAYLKGPKQILDNEQPLVRTFRWGRQDLKFRFPVEPNHLYNVDFYTLEPWDILRNGRIFDIAVNGQVVVSDINPLEFTQGRNRLVRYTIPAEVGDTTCLELSFPNVKSGQAVVCAIAVSVVPGVAEHMVLPALDSVPGYPYSAGLTWAALDTMVLEKTPKDYFPNHDANLTEEIKATPQIQDDGSVRFDFHTGLAHEYILRFRYKNVSGSSVGSRWELRSQVDGRVIAQGTLAFPVTPAKWKPVSTTTGSMINAGAYTLILHPDQQLEFDYLTIE